MKMAHYSEPTNPWSESDSSKDELQDDEVTAYKRTVVFIGFSGPQDSIFRQWSTTGNPETNNIAPGLSVVELYRKGQVGVGRDFNSLSDINLVCPVKTTSDYMSAIIIDYRNFSETLYKIFLKFMRYFVVKVRNPEEIDFWVAAIKSNSDREYVTIMPVFNNPKNHVGDMQSRVTSVDSPIHIFYPHEISDENDMLLTFHTSIAVLDYPLRRKFEKRLRNKADEISKLQQTKAQLMTKDVDLPKNFSASFFYQLFDFRLLDAVCLPPDGLVLFNFTEVFLELIRLLSRCSATTCESSRKVNKCGPVSFWSQGFIECKNFESLLCELGFLRRKIPEILTLLRALSLVSYTDGTYFAPSFLDERPINISGCSLDKMWFRTDTDIVIGLKVTLKNHSFRLFLDLMSHTRTTVARMVHCHNTSALLVQFSSLILIGCHGINGGCKILQVLVKNRKEMINEMQFILRTMLRKVEKLVADEIENIQVTCPICCKNVGKASPPVSNGFDYEAIKGVYQRKMYFTTLICEECGEGTLFKIVNIDNTPDIFANKKTLEKVLDCLYKDVQAKKQWKSISNYLNDESLVVDLKFKNPGNLDAIIKDSIMEWYGHTDQLFEALDEAGLTNCKDAIMTVLKID